MNYRGLSFSVIACLLLVACPAFGDVIHYANPSVGEPVVINYSPEGVSPDSGGPFLAALYPTAGGTQQWTTFCVEADGHVEYFTPGATYQVYGTDPHVAPFTGNYVTDEAKWLYYQSLHDPAALAGYISADLASDVDLQEAIWHGVLGGGIGGSPLSTPYDATAATWYDAAVTAVTAGWADADSVRVITLTDGNGSPAQSQLYETQPSLVPEPSMFILFGTGVVGLLVLVRRKRR